MKKEFLIWKTILKTFKLTEILFHINHSPIVATKIHFEDHIREFTDQWKNFRLKENIKCEISKTIFDKKNYSKSMKNQQKMLFNLNPSLMLATQVDCWGSIIYLPIK